MKILSIISIICLFIFFPGIVLAQQSLQGATDAGQIEKRIENRDRERAKGTDVDRAPPRVEDIKPAEVAPATPEDQEKPFILSAVNIVGASVFDVADFAILYEEFLGTNVTLKDVDSILERITDKYKDAGYFLSYATSPPQTPEFGIVNVRITEGYIEKVTYKGEIPGRMAMFGQWAEKITSEAPSRLPLIERYILLMGDVTGLSATPSLKEIPDSDGAYEMTIALSMDSVDAYTSLDNRGTSPVGPLEWSTSVGANSIFGALERFRVSTYTIPDEPEELLYGEVYGQIPLNSEGTHAFVSGSRSTVDIYSESRASRLQSAGEKYSLGFWHPLVRGQDFSFYVNTRFDYQNNRQSAQDDNYADRLRVVRFGARTFFKDGIGGTNNASVEYSRGLDILHASPPGYDVSRTDGEPAFSKVTATVGRTQKIFDDLFVEISAAGQHSKDVLLSAEEFAVGGSAYGRGYDPSEISDSRGVAAGIEARYRLPFQEGLLSKTWLFGFYDGGIVWRDGNTTDSLLSAGLGFRMFPFDGARISVEAAKPLTRSVAEEGDKPVRVFFSISLEF